MARKTLTIHELNKRNQLSAAFDTLFEAVDATDGAELTPTARDGKYLVLLHNKAAADKTVTVLAGNGIQGTTDHVETLAASSYAAINLESGRFKNVTGDDKGKIILKGEDANIEVAVFELP